MLSSNFVLAGGGISLRVNEYPERAICTDVQLVSLEPKVKVLGACPKLA